MGRALGKSRLEHVHLLEVALDQDLGRRLALQIVLCDELGQDLGGFGKRRSREERGAAEAAAAAHEHQGNTVLAVARGHGDDVGVVVASRGDDLLRLDDLQIGELIAQSRGILELESLRRGFHPAPEFLLDFIVAPFQHLDGRRGVPRVGIRRDEADAGGRAALDLVLQTGPGAIGEVRVRAVAQAEQFLQLLQGLAHRAGRRVRTEKPAGFLARTAVEGKTGELVPRLKM